MKKILLTLLVAAATGSVFGQGQIVFGTRGGGVDARVINSRTGLPVDGANYLAQLYYGAPGVAEDAMVTFAEAPARFGTSATLLGYITTGSGGGNRTVDPTVVAYGADTAFQVRAWEATLGANWTTAYSAWSSLPAGPVLGKSAIIIAKTSADALQVAQPLAGLTGFSLQPIPEPGVLALGALGLVAVLWRRRQ